MRAVVSRVTRASVTVDDEIVATISRGGLLVLLGVARTDTHELARGMARKLHELRILRDERSCADTGAPLLVVSQFTLYGDTRTGRRPSWGAAAPAQIAGPIVATVLEELVRRGASVASGRFGATMEVESVNDGPFTVIVEV